MRYKNNIIKSNRVKELLLKSGMSITEFCKSLWGAKSHNSLSYFDARPDVKVSTLVRMAEILDCSIEDILIKSDDSSDSPTISGDCKVVNSSYVNADVTTLIGEVKALKMVIEEKNQRIEDLKNTNDALERRLDLVLQLGQIKDCK